MDDDLTVLLKKVKHSQGKDFRDFSFPVSTDGGRELGTDRPRKKILRDLSVIGVTIAVDIYEGILKFRIGRR